jgi:hypothetical protein
MSACQSVQMKRPVSHWTDFCDVLYGEILLQFCRENSNSFNIGWKHQPFYVWSFIDNRRNIQPTYLRQTALSQAKKGRLLRKAGMERLSPVLLRPFSSLCFIYRSSRQATATSPLKWNMLRLFSSPRLNGRSKPCVTSGRRRRRCN